MENQMETKMETEVIGWFIGFLVCIQLGFISG